ncbi:MAG: M2 family metallopeptidase, partial [Acidobacteriota bacterium]
MKLNYRSSHFLAGAMLLVAVCLALLSSCSKPGSPSSSSSSGDKGTPAEADQFVADADKRLLDLNVKFSRADWVKSTYITDDTEALSAEANKQVIAATTELAEESRRF